MVLSVRNTYRALRPFYRRQNRPSEQFIRLTMERFRTTFTLIDNSHPQRRRTVRTEEDIATVERSIEEDPNESIRHRAQELICVHPLYGRFYGRILGALWAGGTIGPYFFKNDEVHNVTVNGDWYRAMITNFFIPELNNNDVQELWFQQDGTTCHTARATIDLLKDTFGDRLISRFGPVNWPPRSCDLTPLDYFLWGYVKSLVCADKPQTLDHLEDNIRRVIADIRPQMWEKVIENWTSRLD
ncbi:transposable element Tc3 transposase [Trichonephila clavipes]|nr:transposable element Tc3 transposase [Trichonephila clavipes]